MATSKQYAITATSNDSVSLDSLESEILADAGVVVAFDYILVSSPNFTVHFKATLDSGSETALDAVVAAHSGEDPPEPATLVSQVGIKNSCSYRARLVGSHCEEITKNTSEDIDWTVPAVSWGGVEKVTYFDGVEYYAKDAHVGDTLKFQVVDVDGSGVGHGLYTQAQFDAMKDGGGEYLLEEFGCSVFVVPDSLTDIRLYKARLYKDLVLRVVYSSHADATTNPKFLMNLFRHLHSGQNA